MLRQRTSGKVNAGAYRVIEENKFILVPPNPNLHIVTPIETVPEAGLKNLMDRVGEIIHLECV